MPSTEVDEEIAGVAGEDVTDTQNTKEHFKKKLKDNILGWQDKLTKRKKYK